MLWKKYFPALREVTCRGCGRTSTAISAALQFCADCIRKKPEEALPWIKKVHFESRRQFNLPASAPRAANGVKCNLCVNECVIPPGERGYCGLKANEGNHLVHLAGTLEKAVVEWYYDELPTNCVADWVCPAGTCAGYPTFSYCEGIEYGYKNLAVFYGSCPYNCLYCQNWQFRELTANLSPLHSAEELAGAVTEETACICYFGGDAVPQLPHAIKSAELALERAGGRVLRICWETTGAMHPSLLNKMAQLSLKTGGIIKFDLKAWNENLHIALCGVTNRRTLENFRSLSGLIAKRADLPLLAASTLLVPGYVDEIEVQALARFIAAIDPELPFTLLGFYPQFYLKDLPPTSRQHAERCLEIARKEGLRNVRVRNENLLSNEKYA
ncbi:radical SAM protein [Desulfofundulus sp.]|uniref:radical SAM protein n=1 Tax=Desulfofundulus sp. TaxID=2282750 RepID=UPI003C71F536